MWTPEELSFFNLEIEHDNLIVARDDVFRYLDSPACPPIIALIGPRGVGKTTLAKACTRRTLSANATAMAADPLLLPTYYWEMAEKASPRFDITDFYREQLNAVCLGDVHPDVLYPNRSTRRKPGDYIELKGRRDWANIYREAWIKGLKHRRVIHLFLDEARIFFKASSEELVRTRGDAVRGIAQNAKVVIVLVGGYDLVDKIQTNPDLRRRCAFVEFRRYDADNEKDLKSLYKILRTFAQALPFDRPVDLMEFAPYVIERSFGCTGIMKAILDLAVVTAKQEGVILARKHFGGASLLERFPREQFLAMRDEAIAGEARLAEFLGRTRRKMANAGQEDTVPAKKHRPGQVKTAGKPRSMAGQGDVV